MSDLHASSPRFEAALRELHTERRAGKTITYYAETLAAFCDWALERGYLSLARHATVELTIGLYGRASTSD